MVIEVSEAPTEFVAIRTSKPRRGHTLRRMLCVELASAAWLADHLSGPVGACSHLSDELQAGADALSVRTGGPVHSPVLHLDKGRPEGTVPSGYSFMAIPDDDCDDVLLRLRSVTSARLAHVAPHSQP